MKTKIVNKCLKVSNARIMNKGTHQNIMTQLSLTSDEYALVTALYYVSSKINISGSDVGSQDTTDTVHRRRGTFEFASQEIFTITLAVQNCKLFCNALL